MLVLDVRVLDAAKFRVELRLSPSVSFLESVCVNVAGHSRCLTSEWESCSSSPRQAPGSFLGFLGRLERVPGHHSLKV